jgi:hypothetical protein
MTLTEMQDAVAEARATMRRADEAVRVNFAREFWNRVGKIRNAIQQLGLLE